MAAGPQLILLLLRVELRRTIFGCTGSTFRRSVIGILLICSLPVTSTFSVSQPVINSITLRGNTAFAEREIEAWMSSRPGLPLSEVIFQADMIDVVNRYRTAGYYSARIDSVRRVPVGETGALDLVVYLREGRQTVVDSIIINGESSLSDEDILSTFQTRRGLPLNENVLENDITELLKRFETAGFPFARSGVEQIEMVGGEDESRLIVSLFVDSGNILTIDEFRIEGNSTTDPAVIVRETRFAPGEAFDPRKVDAIRPRLRRLNIFSSVSDPELYIRSNKGGLLIKVQEGNTNTFDGIIGYVPSGSTGESGFVTGLASVIMRNLFGTGRKLNLRWHREDRFSQELGFRYTEPWLLGYPVNLGGGFFQRKQDSTYVRRVFDLKTDLMLSDELSVAALFSSESVIPSDSLSGRVLRSSLVSGGVELQYDSRDDLYSPTGGARYRTDYQYGRKNISRIPVSLQSRIRPGVSIQRFTLDLEFFLEVFRRQVVALGVHGREVRGGQLEEGEMFRFGGMKSLRGYRENQFLGSRIAWSNLEYRFLLTQRSFLYGFFDAGYYLHPGSELRGMLQFEEVKFGYGLGIQLESGLGLMAISFALGEGDTFTTGKVHFGLINEF